METRESIVYRFGEFEVDGLRRVLRRGGQAVAIRPKCFSVLLYLLQQHPRAVPLEELRREVWKIDVSDGAVRDVILDARRTLADTGPPWRWIDASPGVGYRFCCAPQIEDPEGPAPSEPRSTEVLHEPATASDADPASGWRIQQVPEPPTDFLGREQELALLARGIERRERVLLVTGMTGVGKSALACALAARHADEYPDGCIYVDLRSARPLGAIQAMLHVLRSLDPRARLLDDELWIAGAYRSALTGRRLLLVLDDACAASQVQPLVPPSGSVAIVTSRRSLTLAHGPAPLHLGPLDPEAARALIASHAAVEKEFAARLAGLCGGLPLALILAARGLERRDVDPLEYVHELERERAAPHAVGQSPFSRRVHALLRQSTAVLDDELRTRFLLLCVFRGPFDRTAAAAIWEADAVAASEAIGRLLELNLIELKESRGQHARYRLHDLVRVFAARELEPQLRHEAQLRHASHYLDRLLSAERAHVGAHSDRSEILRGLDRDLLDIEQAFLWCSHGASLDPRARALCVQFPCARILQIRLSAANRLAWCDSAIARATDPRSSVLAALHEQRAGALRDLGQLTKAASGYEAAALAAERHGDRLALVTALLGRGVTAYYRGEPRRAIPSLLRSLELSKECGDPAAEGHALRHMGVAWYMAGELLECAGPLHRSIDLARAVRDRLAESRSLIALAAFCRAMADGRAAREWGREAVRLAESLQSRRDGLHARIGLAFTAVDLGEPDEAQSLFEHCLALARELRDARCEAHAIGLGAVVAYARGDLSTALQLCTRCSVMAEQIGDRYLFSWNCGTLGAVLAKGGDGAGALESYQRWIRVAEEIGDRRAAAAAHWYLGRLHYRQGQHALGRQAMSACVRYEEAMRHPRALPHQRILDGLAARDAEGSG